MGEVYEHLCEREMTGILLQELLGLSCDEVRRRGDVSVQLQRLEVAPARWEPAWGTPEQHDCYFIQTFGDSVDFRWWQLDDDRDFIGHAAITVDGAVPIEDLDQLSDWLTHIMGFEDEAKDPDEEEKDSDEEELKRDDDGSDVDSGTHFIMIVIRTAIDITIITGLTLNIYIYI